MMKFMKKGLCIILSSLSLFSVLIAIVPPMTILALDKQDGWTCDFELDGHCYVSYIGTEKAVTVPKEAVGIDYISDSVEELHIPEFENNGSQATGFIGGLSTAKNIKKITMSHANQQFRLQDGVLFTKDMETLVYYPIKKAGKAYHVPEKTTSIFVINSDYLKTITLPNSLLQLVEITAKKVKKIKIPAKVISLERVNIAGNIMIDKNSKYFTKSKGVIFTKDKRSLVYYPPNKKDKTYTAPSEVQFFYSGAFMDNHHLKTLIVNERITNIQSSSITEIRTGKIAKNNFYLANRPVLPKLKKISIAKGNRHYKVSKNVMYTKNGKTLVWYPSGKRNKSFRIPKNVKAEICYFKNRYLENLYVPSGFKFDNLSAYRWEENILLLNGTYLPKLKNIYVDKKNSHYASVKGVLFNKNKKTLIYYPGGRKASSYTVPTGVTTFYDSTFQDVTGVLIVKLPPTIKRILGKTTEPNAIPLPDFSIRYKNITFLVKQDSTTHKTLEKYGFAYKFY